MDFAACIPASSCALSGEAAVTTYIQCEMRLRLTDNPKDMRELVEFTLELIDIIAKLKYKVDMLWHCLWYG